KVIIILVFMVIAGSLAIVHYEENIKLKDALWWSVVTLTTVGYGDISPATIEGRIVGVIIMISGIGFLGMLTASIASLFVENRILENKGMKGTRMKNHFIICGWNFRGHDIIEELRSDPKCSSIPMVLTADIPEKPLDDPLVHFVRGEVNQETMKKANIEFAQVAVILSDDRLDAYSRDAKTILSTLTIKNMNSEIYTCVELMDPKNVEHCHMARADEIIVSGELSTNLLVQAALDHGITRMVSELVSKRYGKDLYKIRIPRELKNKDFYTIMSEMKRLRNILCVGVEDKAGNNFVANPANDYIPAAEDLLIVIAEERPKLAVS
ncbi:ion channel, partial [Desulfobacterales bacterium HSG16]|nr:ion channel [Desulfobacterales bacterium HSG16]